MLLPNYDHSRMEPDLAREDKMRVEEERAAHHAAVAELHYVPIEIFDRDFETSRLQNLYNECVLPLSSSLC